MKRLLIVLLIALISVGCSNKNSQQSSQATPESSQTSEKNLTIEDVEGYWECKSDEEGILLKLGWNCIFDAKNGLEHTVNILREIKSELS